MSKKLSIIVPVYNMAAEGKLNYCLDSLVGQTIRGVYDYEILCVDDASTDESLEILLDYQKRYPELICVIPNAVNLRQGGAKNVGLKNAEGEWIGFIDSDDWVSPDYYEKLLSSRKKCIMMSFVKRRLHCLLPVRKRGLFRCMHPMKW